MSNNEPLDNEDSPLSAGQGSSEGTSPEASPEQDASADQQVAIPNQGPSDSAAPSQGASPGQGDIDPVQAAQTASNVTASTGSPEAGVAVAGAEQAAPQAAGPKPGGGKKKDEEKKDQKSALPQLGKGGPKKDKEPEESFWVKSLDEMDAAGKGIAESAGFGSKKESFSSGGSAGAPKEEKGAEKDAEKDAEKGQVKDDVPMTELKNAQGADASAAALPNVDTEGPGDEAPAGPQETPGLESGGTPPAPPIM